MRCGHFMLSLSRFICLQGLSREIARLRVVSVDRSLLKGEAPRFSAIFVHPLSCERLFKFQRHLIQDFRCDKLVYILQPNKSRWTVPLRFSW
jgi:hypothetical protein